MVIIMTDHDGKVLKSNFLSTLANWKKIMLGLYASPKYPQGTFWNRLFAPVDIAILVYFRIVFGAIMLWEVWRYFSHDWISLYYIEPTFYFSYYGFDWVKPWAGDGMYLHFYALGALAICIILGLGYRVTSALFFLGFTYVFLLDQANYLNHFYLVSLISLLMIFVPAHRAFSLDALLRPRIRSDTAPAWTLWMLLAQIGIVYFYGGLAKLNSDWLRGEPLNAWLAGSTDFPLIGSLFTEEWVVFLLAYGALLIDLLIVPFLLWRPTRLPAFVIVAAFHLMNSELFSIGIFPWFMIFAALLFFPSEWPRQIFNRFFLRFLKGRSKHKVGSESQSHRTHHTGTSHLKQIQKVTIVLLMIYFSVQLAVPLRHHFYPSKVSWTEEGHNFSWMMKLRDKDTTAIVFYVTDPITDRTWTIDPEDELTSRQFSKMSTRPDMILQYSHHIADELRQQGYEKIEVRVWVMASLNDREPQLLIDPEVNLAAQQRDWLHSPWIVPLRD